MKNVNPTAALLIGHGSRAPGANANMYRVAAEVHRRGRFQLVRCGFLELNEPSIPVAIEGLVRSGARRIIVIPYFLHMGRHIREDIPEQVAASASAHPGVEIILGGHLDFDPALADIVEKRIAEAASGKDLEGRASADTVRMAAS